MSINKDLAKFILHNGKLYVPATSHYPEMDDPVVKCDYCGKSELDISIGHNQNPSNKLDICLKCASVLEADNGVKSIFTLPRPRQYNSQYDLGNLTMMVQDSVRGKF